MLKEVQEFFQIEVDPNLTGMPEKENSAFRGRERPELPRSEIFWMNRLAGREIRAGSFELRSGARDLGGLARSAMDLPFWALRAYSDLSDRTESSVLSYIWRRLFHPSRLPSRPRR